MVGRWKGIGGDRQVGERNEIRRNGNKGECKGV